MEFRLAMCGGVASLKSLDADFLKTLITAWWFSGEILDFLVSGQGLESGRYSIIRLSRPWGSSGFRGTGADSAGSRLFVADLGASTASIFVH